MANTTNLALPLIDQNQSQKHVTHNEALRALDAIVHLSVIDDALSTPPGSPANGDRYIVAASPTDEWAGQQGKLAASQDGAWRFYAPKTGWRVYIASKTSVYVYDGANWVSIVSVLQNLALLGVGATADASNPFLVKLNATLWTAKYAAEGGNGDLIYKLNKESAAKSASQLYQTNFSGRAETGLTGDDDFHIKVSPDGSAWKEAVVFDRSSGKAAFQQNSLQAAKEAHGGTIKLSVLEDTVALSGPTTDAAVQIPANCIVIGVSNRVITAITGAASYDCGDVGGSQNRFGGSLGVAAGSTNFGLIGPNPYYANTTIRYTANGGNFTGGVVRMTIHFLSYDIAAN